MRWVACSILVVHALAAVSVSVASGSEHSAEVEFAERAGRMIYAKDRAAWMATDALFAGTAEDNRIGVIGWITVESGSGWLVQFVGGMPDSPCVLFEVPVAESAGSLTKNKTCEPLAENLASMFRARQTAISVSTERCSERYNTVVVSADLVREDGWLVYLLAATTVPGEMVFGGHYRVLVSADGNTVSRVEPLSRSCLTMPSAEKETVASFVTHMLSDTPVETHVFLSLSHEQAIYVMTDYGMWSAEDGAIRLLLSGEAWESYRERALQEGERSGRNE